MKQECGETLGDLGPVYDLFTIAGEFTLTETVTQTCGFFVKQVVRRVNDRGPLPLRDLHSTEETKECGETLGDHEPVYHLFTVTSDFTLPKAVIHVACT